MKYFAIKKFDYAIVPDQNNLMKDLKIREYTTSLIINKKGLIAKVVDTPQELNRAMETVLAKH